MGDPFGMPVTHAVAAGMGGIRTAGDLVMWMQMARRMRLSDAKAYVAQKLNVSLPDLVDECVMRVRIWGSALSPPSRAFTGV